MASKKKSTAVGLRKEVEAALSYVLGPVTGILFFLIEKDPFVRFHAMQSIVTFGALFLLQWLLPFTIVLLPVVPVLTLVGFVLWLLLIYKAWQGDMYKLPFFGNLAAKWVKKF